MFEVFTLHVMNLKYMKVSRFEISYKKKKITIFKFVKVLLGHFILFYSFIFKFQNYKKDYKLILNECFDLSHQNWELHHII